MLSSSLTKQRIMVEINNSRSLTKVQIGIPGIAISRHLATSPAAVTIFGIAATRPVGSLTSLTRFTTTPMNFKSFRRQSMLAIIGASCSIRLRFIEQSVGMPRLKSAMPCRVSPVGKVRLDAPTFGSDRSRQTGGVSAWVSSSGRAMSIVAMRGFASDRVVRRRHRTDPGRDAVDGTAGENDVVGLDHQGRLRGHAHHAVGHDDAVAVRILDDE